MPDHATSIALVALGVRPVAVPPPTPGLLLLFNGPRLAYAEAAADVPTRLAAVAAARDKPFTAASYLPAPVGDLAELERRVVAAFDPPLNRARRSAPTPDGLAAAAAVVDLAVSIITGRDGGTPVRELLRLVFLETRSQPDRAALGHLLDSDPRVRWVPGDAVYVPAGA